TERYDGDGVMISDANGDGVPDKPAADLLRARATSEYDERGRVFRTHVYSVDPASGAISANSLTTDLWYGRRGQLLKTSEPGGVVSKMLYDGAGRPVIEYVSDGGGDRKSVV